MPHTARSRKRITGKPSDHPSSKLIQKMMSISYYPLLLLAAAGAVIFVYFLIRNAAWILGDDKQMLETILSGKMWPLTSGWQNGRFYPLYYIEFAPFILLGNMPGLVFSWVAAKMLASIILLYLVFREILTATPYEIKNPVYKPSAGNIFAFIFILLFLLGPEIFKVFAVTIFPEQTLIPALALFIYAYIRIEKNGSPVWILTCLLAANIACYLKEPAFAIILTVGASGLLLFRNRSRKQLLTDIMLIASAIIFVALYYFLVRRNAHTLYNEGRALGRGYWDIAKSLVGTHPILLLLTAVAVARSAMIFVKRSWNLMDALLFASLAYAAAFIVLKLDFAYYLTPIYVLSLPPLLYFMTKCLTDGRLAGRAAAALVALSLILCFIPALENTTAAIKDYQTARIEDPLLVDLLARSQVCFYTVPADDTKMKFLNDVDAWQKETFGDFIDFKRNGIVTGAPQIETITEFRTERLRGPDTVILIPERLRNLGLARTHRLYLLRTTCGVDCYSFSPRHMALFSKPVKLSADVPAQHSAWFRYGWSFYESSVKSRWTDGEEAELFLPVGDISTPLELTIKGRPWVPRKERIIDVYASRTKIATWRFTRSYEQIERKAVIPQNLIRNGTVEIILKIRNAVSPREIGESDETRKLGLLCSSFRLDPVRNK